MFASMLLPYLPGPGQIWGIRSYLPPPWHRPLVHIPPVEVDGSTNCPNIHCTTTAPHTYYFDVIEPCPEGISELRYNTSIPTLIHFPMTSDTRLWKHHLFFWSMVVRCTFLAMV